MPTPAEYDAWFTEIAAVAQAEAEALRSRRPRPPAGPTPGPKPPAPRPPAPVVVTNTSAVPMDVPPIAVDAPIEDVEVGAFFDPPRRTKKKSPLQFGGGYLTPVTTTLYDSALLVPYAGSLRFFTDTVGKTNAEIHPTVMGGGQLPAPKLFVMRGLRVAYQVQDLPEGHRYDPVVGRTDVEQIKAVSSLRFIVGHKEYFTGPPAVLPYRCPRDPIVIPCRQAFWAEWSLRQSIRTAYPWRLFVKLDGTLGTEIQ